MKRTIFAKQRPQQSGFTPGRSTLDGIVALRLLAVRRREYRQPLYAAYIDLRAAFDSLERNSLWNILKTIGIPPKLVDIIKTLYSSTHSVVRVNGTISEAFSISSGVRQAVTILGSENCQSISLQNLLSASQPFQGLRLKRHIEDKNRKRPL